MAVVTGSRTIPGPPAPIQRTGGRVRPSPVPPPVSVIPSAVVGGVCFIVGLVYFHVVGSALPGFGADSLPADVRAVGGFWSLLGHALTVGFLVTVIRERLQIGALVKAAEDGTNDPDGRIAAVRASCLAVVGHNAPAHSYQAHLEVEKHRWWASAGSRWWWYFPWAVAVFLPSTLYLMTNFYDPTTSLLRPFKELFGPVAIGGLEMLIALFVGTKVRTDWQGGIDRLAAAINQSFEEDEPESEKRDEPVSTAKPKPDLHIPARPPQSKPAPKPPEVRPVMVGNGDTPTEPEAPITWPPPPPPPSSEPRPRRKYEQGDDEL